MGGAEGIATISYYHFDIWSSFSGVETLISITNVTICAALSYCLSFRHNIFCWSVNHFFACVLFIYLALSDQKQWVHQCIGVSHFATILVTIYAGVFIQVWSPLPLCTELDPWAKQSSAIQPNITINAGSNCKNTFWSYFAALRGGFTCDECWYFIGFYFTITLLYVGSSYDIIDFITKKRG